MVTRSRFFEPTMGANNQSRNGQLPQVTWNQIGEYSAIHPGAKREGRAREQDNSRERTDNDSCKEFVSKAVGRGNQHSDIPVELYACA